MPSVKVRFAGDATQLNKTADAVKGKLSGLGGFGRGLASALGGLGASLGVGAAVAGVQSLVSEFARLKDLADRLGTDAETMQKIGRLAQLGGADVETLARALTKMTATLNGGDKAAESAAATLDKLGINAGKFAAAKLDQKVIMLADAYAATGGKGEAFAAVLDLIGIKGADLIPMFREGGEAARAAMDGMVVASNDAVAAIARLDDQWALLLGNVKAGVAGPLGTFIEAINQSGSPMDWWDKWVELDYQRLDRAQQAKANAENEAMGAEVRTFPEGQTIAEKNAKIASAKVSAILKEAVESVFGGDPFSANYLQRKEAIERVEQRKRMRTLEDYEAEKRGVAPGRRVAPDEPPPTMTRPGDLISDLARVGGAAGLGEGFGSKAIALAESSNKHLADISSKLGKAETLGTYS